MRKGYYLRIVCPLFLCLLAGGRASAGDVPYGVGDWPDSLGNHRARVQVAAKADAVWVHIPWRRRDATPDKKEIIVIDAATNKRVENVLRVHVEREFGDLLFQPPTAPGEYYVYYHALSLHRLLLVADDHLHAFQPTPPRPSGRKPASRWRSA